MTIDEYEPDDILCEISRKLANVNIHNLSLDANAETLPTIRYYLYSHDKAICLQSVEMLRRYLTQSSSSSESAQDILKLDVLPRINEMLAWEEASSIQFECAWIVTNIAAGSSDQTHALVESGIIDSLLVCICHDNCAPSTSAQIAWALSNFAGESAQLREMLMEKRAPAVVAEVLKDIYNEIYAQVYTYSYSYGKMHIADQEVCTNVKALVWSLANMSRGGFKTANYWPVYCPVFEILGKLIHFDHNDILTDACWGLSRILYSMHEVPNFYRNVSISVELCSKLSQLLRRSSVPIIVPALRAIINITSGPDEHSVILLKSGLLRNIVPLMTQDFPAGVRRDAFLLIGNIAVCGDSLIQKVIANNSIVQCVLAHVRVPGKVYNTQDNKWLPTLAHGYCEVDEEWKITNEALSIISNIISRGSSACVRELLKKENDVPATLVHLLRSPEIAIQHTQKCIDAIINLVERTNSLTASDPQRNPNQVNEYAIELLNHGLMPLLEGQYELHDEDESIKSRYDILSVLLEDGIAAKKEMDAKQKQSQDMASLFGLSESRNVIIGVSKRRVLHGPEDGDIRLIENAIGNLSVSYSGQGL
ncbi:armadillo-type protein [Phycomyces nitens]|nr:armadillo-type protein [Phycomyces nitens]